MHPCKNWPVVGSGDGPIFPLTPKTRQAARSFIAPLSAIQILSETVKPHRWKGSAALASPYMVPEFADWLDGAMGNARLPCLSAFAPYARSG